MRAEDRAGVVAEAVVMNLFLHMLNPRMRGQKFRWSGFVDMAVRMAVAQVPISMSAYKPRMQPTVERWAKYTAENCLKESGVEEWMVLGSEQTGGHQCDTE